MMMSQISSNMINENGKLMRVKQTIYDRNVNVPGSALGTISSICFKAEHQNRAITPPGSPNQQVNSRNCSTTSENPTWTRRHLSSNKQGCFPSVILPLSIHCASKRSSPQINHLLEYAYPLYWQSWMITTFVFQQADLDTPEQVTKNTHSHRHHNDIVWTIARQTHSLTL